MILDMSQISDKQDAFLRDDHRHVAYGGARGGGKSWAVRTKAKILACEYPGIKLLIVRKTYRELANNHIDVLRPELHGIAKYNKSDKVFTFRNGSTLAFGYCATDSDLMQYQGAEYDVIFLDEAGQLQEDWIKKINACVRGTNGFPKRTYYTLNPGGPAHGYFKRLFVDRRFEDGERPENYSFIQALVTDNKALMATQPDYITELENLPPKLREAWLYGSWDIFEGQFFEDFRPDPPVKLAKDLGTTVEELRKQHRWCHVIEPFEPPRGWNIMRSYDFGYGKPFSVGYWAVDYDGVLYRIMEMYGCTATPNEGVKWSPDDQFRRTAELERELKELRERPVDVAVQTLDASAEQIAAAVKEAEKAAKAKRDAAVAKKAEELKAAEEQRDEARKAVENAEAGRKAAEEQAAALRAELEKARKSAAAMDNKALAEFGVLFRQAQER